MTAGQPRQGPSWTARIAWALLLLLVGAAAAIWGLSRWEAGARFFGVTPKPPLQIVRQNPVPAAKLDTQVAEPLAAVDAARISTIESRLAAIETKAQAAAGSAGRADAMLIAFAARRAVDRGVALGYLEPLLVQRFGAQHQAAIATIITASRNPVRLDDLVAEYRALEPTLSSGGADEGWWQAFRREMGSIISVHRADTPSPQPHARYERALARLEAGQVDIALTETMRLPGSASATQWIARARAYIAAHRALDAIETAALLGSPSTENPPIPGR